MNESQTEMAMRNAEELAKLGRPTAIVLMKAIESMARTMGSLSFDHAGIALRHLQELHDAYARFVNSKN